MRLRLLKWVLIAACCLGAAAQSSACSGPSQVTSDGVFKQRTVVTSEAKGARCAIAADLDGDGLLDIVSASSTDNTVAYFRNEGGGLWSGKQDITYVSNGARIVTTGDLDGDGDIDVVAASYYDNTIRWFENDGSGGFPTTHMITQTAINAQGVHVADLDGDGDLDLASASSGDNTVAVYINVFNGTFCEVKRVVDANAIGVRTVVAADLDGDGDNDLVSASKDDHTVAWYPNDGAANFPEKIIISNSSFGAYSLVARDIDSDSDIDLVVASNGDDTVAIWRNNGRAQFVKIIVYASADFVLSVTAFDFDRDGDVDIASASYFDGYVRWYENVDGRATRWQNHTLYIGSQGHYVSSGDMDGDGDEDLIAVTKSENRVQVFYAATTCDNGARPGSAIGTSAGSARCCRLGQEWNGSACASCQDATYGVINSSGSAQCARCPATCTIPGLSVTPATCWGVTGCNNARQSAAACTCASNSFLSNATQTCASCATGHVKASPALERPVESFRSSGELWIGLRDTCELVEEPAYNGTPLIAGFGAGVGALILVFLAYCWRSHRQTAAVKERTRKKMEAQAQLLDRMFDASRDVLLLCEMDEPSKPPRVKKVSPNVHAVLGETLEAGKVFNALPAEHYIACVRDMDSLRTSTFFAERVLSMPNGLMLAFSGHVVDDTHFLITLRDVTAAKQAQEAEIAAVQAKLRHSLALETIADVVLELSVADWSDELNSCSVVEANDAYEKLFGVQPTSRPGAWPALCLDSQDLRRVLARHAGCAMHAEVRFVLPDDDVRHVRVSTVAGVGVDRLLAVCHDLSDFRERIELEKDRQLVGTLQHEEKNAHLAQELDVRRALSGISSIRTHIDEQRVALAKTESSEQMAMWTSFERSMMKALDDTDKVLHDVATRSREAQQQTHNQVMLRQLVRKEYVPACTPIDVEERLRGQLGRASEVNVEIDGKLPELLLDWNLIWHALTNALSNARKYGDGRRIAIHVLYTAPRLTFVVANSVHAEVQARLIASHGTDGTSLLHGRVEGGAAMSTNMGSRALLATSHLLKGGVTLRLNEEETRLHLEIEAALAVDPVALLREHKPVSVWFLDDEPTMRMRYASWLEPPLDVEGSRVLPADDLIPEETDRSMRAFACDVLAAVPQPDCVVIDQNLQSMVEYQANATTGTQLASELRKGLYKGIIVIRTANVSRPEVEEYMAAGASHVTSKDDSREGLLRLIASSLCLVDGRAPASSLKDMSLPEHAPILTGELRMFDRARRDVAIKAFREGARETVSAVRALYDKGRHHAIPLQLNRLMRLCSQAGTLRLLRTAQRCSAEPTAMQIEELENVLAMTLDLLSSGDGSQHTSHDASNQPGLFKGPISAKLMHSFSASSEDVLASARQAIREDQSCKGQLHRLQGASACVNAFELRDRARQLQQRSRVSESDLEQLAKLREATLVAMEQSHRPTIMKEASTVEPIDMSSLVHKLQPERRTELLTKLFDSSYTHGLPCKLRLIESQLRSGERIQVLSLKGLAATFGLTALLAQVVAFQSNPTEDGIASLWSVMQAAKKELIDSGVLTGNGGIGVDATSKGLRGDSPTCPMASLVCVSVDDDPMIREAHEDLFLRIGATSSRVMGATAEEQLDFVKVALSDPELGRAADIAVLDQHIELDGRPHLLGSEIAVQLRTEGFKGIICVVSSDDSANLAALRATPGVDMVVSKAALYEDLAARLSSAFAVRASALSNGPELTSSSTEMPPLGESPLNLERRVRVLVVEDEPTIAESVVSFCRECSYQVEWAPSGEAALDMISEPLRFELLLVDVCLMGLSGIELVHKVRRQYGERLSLVVVSADDRYEERSILFGADMFLSKPTTMRDISMLWQLVARRSRQAQPSPTPSSKDKHILCDAQLTSTIVRDSSSCDSTLAEVYESSSVRDASHIVDSSNIAAAADDDAWLDAQLDKYYPGGRVFSLDPYEHVQELGEGVRHTRMPTPTL